MIARGCRSDRGYSYSEIERVASAIRQRGDLWGHPLAPDEPVPLIPIVDSQRALSLNGAGWSIPGEVAIAELGEDVEGTTGFSDRAMTVTLTDGTYRGVLRHDGRSRFTVAHELGHFFLHAMILAQMKQLPHLKNTLARGGHPIYLDTEWQADAFAGSLLVPAPGLIALGRRRKLTAASVVQRYAVSFAAARKAIRTLEQRWPGSQTGGLPF